MSTDDGKHHVGAVAGGDHRDALSEPFQHVLGGHARNEHVEHLAPEQFAVAADQRAVHGAFQVADRRGDEQRFFWQHIRLRFETRQRLGHRGHLLRVAAVGHHGGGVSVLTRDLDQAQLDDLGRPRSGVRSLALTASTTGVPRFAAMRALVSSSLGVVTSV